MNNNAHVRRARVAKDRSNSPKPQVKAKAPSRAKAPAKPLQGVFGALMPELQRAVTSEGYVTPTPIQEQCIAHVLAGRDVLGTAQTGTGKTAAFALPLLQRLRANPGRPQRNTPRALILAPTRELAAQIGDSIKAYGRFLRSNHTVIYGGVSQHPQVKAMARGVDVLVATPGRLLDLMQQRHIFLNKIEVFVLDEVDRMLDMGFIPDIRRIMEQIPDARQTLFFSATMSAKVCELANTMVTDPVQVAVAPEKLAVERIEQKMMFVDKHSKASLLTSLLCGEEIGKALVFTQMKHVANRVVEWLCKADIDSVAIHGNKSQAARTKALNGFKRGRFRVLVATDVAARGLDVDDITHVINYDLPMEAETYVHRIGRTARAGADGVAISLCCAEDRAFLKAIERLLGKPVPADVTHAYHCDAAMRSSKPAPKNFGRTSGYGGKGGQGGGNARPNRGPQRSFAKHRGRSGSRSRSRGGR